MKILQVLLWPLRNRRDPATAAAADSDSATARVPYDDLEVVYATPNYATRWRVNTFFEKEPDTLEWIAGFKPDEVMVDVGANVGMYSIWAAITRNVRVFAFEPESQNFALLYQNIVHNDLSRKVTGYCAALSDESGFASLYLSEFVAGSSVHTYGAELDFKLQPRASKVIQGCFATTLDHLVATGAVPLPHHIKIDVDGLEHKVLAGCRNVLAEPAVKSVLLEINTNLEEHRALVTLLENAGFAYSPDQVNRYIRKEGGFKGVGNYVFYR
jgi:FkbM family methyltransferase